MQQGYDGPLVNIGCGQAMKVRELAETLVDMVGFEGRIVFDATKSDGTPCKLLDVPCLATLGWRARAPLREGIALPYADFKRQKMHS